MIDIRPVQNYKIHNQGYGHNCFRMKKETFEVINKAFYSLSFRGSNMYPQKEKPVVTRPSRTYGGIISHRTEDGTAKYILVQGRYTGKWSFPKGHLNKNETTLECAKREIYEETSIEELPEHIDNIKLGYGSYYVFEVNGPLNLNPKDTREIINTRWVTLDEMTTMSVNADVNLFIKMMNYKEKDNN